MNKNNYMDSLKLLGTACIKASRPIVEWLPRYWLTSSKYGAMVGLGASVSFIGYYFYKYGPTFVMRFPIYNTGLQIQYDIFSFPVISALSFACAAPQIIPMSVYITAKYFILKWFNTNIPGSTTTNLITSSIGNLVQTNTSSESISIVSETTIVDPTSDKREIPSIDFVEDKPENCFICCEKLEEIDNALSCGHYMHRYCFLKSKKTSCPQCRQEVRLSRDEYYLLATNSIV